MLSKFGGICCRLDAGCLSASRKILFPRSVSHWVPHSLGRHQPPIPAISSSTGRAPLSGRPWFDATSAQKLLRATSLDMVLEGLRRHDAPDTMVVDAAFISSCRLLEKGSTLKRKAPCLAVCLQDLAETHFSAEPNSLGSLSNKVFASWVRYLGRLNLLKDDLLQLVDKRFWLQLGEWTGTELRSLLYYIYSSSQWNPTHECLHILSAELTDRMASDNFSSFEAATCFRILIVGKRYYTKDLINSSKDFLLRHQEQLSIKDITEFSFAFKYAQDPEAFQILNKVMQAKLTEFTVKQLLRPVSGAAHLNVISTEFIDSVIDCSANAWSNYGFYVLAELADILSRFGTHQVHGMQQIVDTAVEKIKLKEEDVCEKGVTKLLNAAACFPGIRIKHLCEAAIPCLSSIHRLTAGLYFIGKMGALTPDINMLATNRLLNVTDIDPGHMVQVLWGFMHSGKVDKRLLVAWHKTLAKRIGSLDQPRDLHRLIKLYMLLPTDSIERKVLFEAVYKRTVEENDLLGWNVFTDVSYFLLIYADLHTTEALGEVMERKVKTLAWRKHLHPTKYALLVFVLHKVNRLTEDVCKVVVHDYCDQLSSSVREDDVQFLQILFSVNFGNCNLLDKMFESVSSRIEPLTASELYFMYVSALPRTAELPRWVVWLEHQLQTCKDDLNFKQVLKLMRLVEQTKNEARNWDLWSHIENRVIGLVNELSLVNVVLCITSFWSMGRFRPELLDCLERLLADGHSFGDELAPRHLVCVLDYCISCGTARPFLIEKTRERLSSRMHQTSSGKVALSIAEVIAEDSACVEADGTVLYAWKGS